MKMSLKSSELPNSCDHLDKDSFINKTSEMILKKTSVLTQLYRNQHLITIKMECNHMIGVMRIGVLNGMLQM